MANLIECSVCTGQPVFLTGRSYLQHVERCHEVFASPENNRFTTINDKDILNVTSYLAPVVNHCEKEFKEIETFSLTGKTLRDEHDKSIDWLTKKITSQESELAEVKDHLKWVMRVLSKDKDIDNDESRSARMNVLKENAIRVKKKELQLTEEIESLKKEQKEIEEQLLNEENKDQSDINLQQVIQEGFGKVCEKINHLEKRFGNDDIDEKYQALIMTKDKQIKEFIKDNEILLEQRDDLRLQIESLKEKAKRKAEEPPPISYKEMEQVSKEASFMNEKNDMFRRFESITSGKIASTQEKIEELQKKLTEKDEQMSKMKMFIQKKATRKIKDARQQLVTAESEKKEMQLNIERLESSLREYKDELAITKSNVTKSEELAQEREKILLENCIKKLELEYGVEKYAQDLLVKDLSRQLSQVKIQLQESQNRISILEDEKIRILLLKDEKEAELEKQISNLQSEKETLSKQIVDLKEQASQHELENLDKIKIEEEAIRMRQEFEEKLEIEKEEIKLKHSKQLEQVEKDLKVNFEKELNRKLQERADDMENEFNSKLLMIKEKLQSEITEKFVREKEEYLTCKDHEIEEMNENHQKQNEYITKQNKLNITEIKEKFANEKSEYMASHEREIADLKQRLIDEYESKLNNEKVKFEEHMQEQKLQFKHLQSEMSELMITLTKSEERYNTLKTISDDKITIITNESCMKQNEIKKLEVNIQALKTSEIKLIEERKPDKELIKELEGRLSKAVEEKNNIEKTEKKRNDNLRKQLERCMNDLTKSKTKVKALEESKQKVAQCDNVTVKTIDKATQCADNYTLKCGAKDNCTHKYGAKDNCTLKCGAKDSCTLECGVRDNYTLKCDKEKVTETSRPAIVKVKKSVSFNDDLNIRYFDKKLSIDEDICNRAIQEKIQSSIVKVNQGDDNSQVFSQTRRTSVNSSKKKLNDAYFDDLMDKILQMDDDVSKNATNQNANNKKFGAGDALEGVDSDKNEKNEIKKGDNDNDDVTEDITVSDIPCNKFDYEEVADLPDDVITNGNDKDQVQKCHNNDDDVTEDITVSDVPCNEFDYEEVAELPDDVITNGSKEDQVEKGDNNDVDITENITVSEVPSNEFDYEEAAELPDDVISSRENNAEEQCRQDGDENDDVTGGDEYLDESFEEEEDDDNDDDNGDNDNDDDHDSDNDDDDANDVDDNSNDVDDNSNDVDDNYNDGDVNSEDGDGDDDASNDDSEATDNGEEEDHFDDNRKDNNNFHDAYVNDQQNSITFYAVSNDNDDNDVIEEFIEEIVSDIEVTECGGNDEGEMFFSVNNDVVSYENYIDNYTSVNSDANVGNGNNDIHDGKDGKVNTHFEHDNDGKGFLSDLPPMSSNTSFVGSTVNVSMETVGDVLGFDDIDDLLSNVSNVEPMF